MENEALTILENLIKIEKRSDASKEKQNFFYKNWLNVAKNQGLNVAEPYFYRGFSFCGAKPLKQYISETPEPDKTLAEFFSGEWQNRDSSYKFRVVTHLLALFLNDGDKLEIISKLIEKFLKTCRNKENKPVGTATQTVKKYFLEELKFDSNIPPLSKLAINPPTLETFAKVMTVFTSDIKSQNVSKLKAWLNDSDKASKNFVEESPVSNSDTANVKPSVAISQVLKSVIELENKNAQYENEKLKLQHSLAEERAKLQDNLQKIDELEKNLDSLKNEISQKDEIINRQTTEIADLTKMEKILRNNQNFKADEMIQKISSKLQVEYQDFQTALNEPMYEDLGENFRQQLKNIFRELERIGVKFS